MPRVNSKRLTGVYNQAIVDWMRNLTASQLVPVIEKCIAAGWRKTDPSLLSHACWMLAYDKWSSHSLETTDWTMPNARDADEATRFAF